MGGSKNCALQPLNSLALLSLTYNPNVCLSVLKYLK